MTHCLVEILFTWRAESGSLEIRVNNKLVSALRQDGLAEDFFSKFVSAEPVSPTLKSHLSEAFERVLQSSDTSSEAPLRSGREQVETPAGFAQCRSLSSLMDCARRLREKRPALLEEVYASLFILFYCCLLITQSLPSRSRLAFRVVRLRDKLSSLKSNLQLSAENFAKKCSIHNALHLLSADSVATHNPTTR